MKYTPYQWSSALGCMLGQACGDALGTTLEFKSADRCQELYPQGLRDIVGGGAFNVEPGQVTDDTEMAMALARSLTAEGVYHRRKVREAYKAWANSRPIDMGGATSQALLQNSPNPVTEANGALMRVSPLGVFLFDAPSALLAFGLGAADAALTHPSQVCQNASGIFVATIAHAIANPHLIAEQLFNFAHDLAIDLRAESAADDLEWAANRNLYPSASGHVRVAFRLAFYHLLHTKSFEEAVVDTVMRGEDADTNGAIVGALMGAAHGANSVPPRWEQTVHNASVRRPSAYQVTDLAQVTADLMTSGR